MRPVLRKSRLPFLGSILVLGVLAATWFGCNDQADRALDPSALGPIDNASRSALSMDNPALQTVAAVQERHTSGLLAMNDVVGTGIGASASGEPVVLILTRRAGVPDLPATLEGIPTRVDVVGDVKAMAAGFKGTYRPVPGGVSVGNDRECAAGSIGAIVFRGGTPCILSNNHVLARINAAAIGERIDQPGRYDARPQCTQTGQVATLTAFVQIRFGGGQTNVVDAAVAQLTTAHTCSMVNNLYTPSTTTVAPSVGLAVKKVGRTSGLTNGTISGVNVTINVNYGSPGVATFVNQIYVASNFIRSGDSGSMMVTQSGNNPVGLNFAGSSGASFANPISNVLQSLNASICGQ